jgi:hypothetical protein
MTRSHWLTVFTVESWQEFSGHGGDVVGFSERRWSSVQKFQEGDYFICYLTKISRFVGLLEAIGKPFIDSSEKIWSSQVFPSRVPVRTLLTLEPSQGIPVQEMLGKLKIFRAMTNPNLWSVQFQYTPRRLDPEDGETVIRALRDAQEGQ